MPIYTTLISVDQLLADRQADWVVFDCRFDLAQPEQGLADYGHAHLPGARYAHLDRDLSAERTATSGRHPLPQPAQLAAWLGEQGVGADTQVVVYDAQSGAFAARLWWLLTWLGHERVAVLDGGLAAWKAKGLPLTAELPQAQAQRFVPQLRTDMTVTAEDLQSTAQAYLLLDARAPARFRGEVEPIDPVAGHVPGARNYDFSNNLQAGQQFHEAAELRQRFAQQLAATPPEQVVCMCGSGVTACHNLLAMQHAGLRGMKLYPGSWSEWIRDPNRPVARGDEA